MPLSSTRNTDTWKIYSYKISYWIETIWTSPETNKMIMFKSDNLHIGSQEGSSVVFHLSH